MPCDTRLKPRQTIQSRKDEVRKVIERLNKGLTAGAIRAVVGKEGGIAFIGLSNEERDGVTDACMFRKIMVTGSSQAKAAIARAEQMAGRTVNRTAVAQGLHSHDGGKSWHHGH